MVKHAHDPSPVYLPPNEVACSLRLVRKATADQFDSPQRNTVTLSQPVPRHAFVRRWGSAAALRSLTWAQRRQLLQLTARSGSLTNLEVLLDLTEHCPLRPDVLEAAAGAGQLAVCQALLQRGCPLSAGALNAAAASGHRAMCEWLLAGGCPWSHLALSKAAAGGHVGLTDWLLAAQPNDIHDPLLIARVAGGCDQATLQRRYEAWVERLEMAEDLRERQLLDLTKEVTMATAVCGPTPDWKAKAEWLEARGFRARPRFMTNLFRREDWRGRLEWLLQRGCPVTQDLVLAAARAGNTDALDSLLSEATHREAVPELLEEAACRGYLQILDLLVSRGLLPSGDNTTGVFEALRYAVWNGHIPADEWLAQRLGPGALEGRIQVLAAAGAASGSLGMVRWLHDRGCPWSARAFTAAAGKGSEEQLEWLAEHGCPMGDDGAPYVQPAGHGDLSTLRCLRRLGCPWSDSDGKTFTQAVEAVARDFVERGCPRPAGLVWLLEQGCPVDWDEVEGLKPGLKPGVVDWLRGVQQRSRELQQHEAAAAASEPMAAAGGKHSSAPRGS